MDILKNSRMEVYAAEPQYQAPRTGFLGMTIRPTILFVSPNEVDAWGLDLYQHWANYAD